LPRADATVRPSPTRGVLVLAIGMPQAYGSNITALLNGIDR